MRKAETRRVLRSSLELLAIVAILSAVCALTGADYVSSLTLLILSYLFISARDLEDKADELLGNLPAKVLECPYGHGKCEAHPTGRKPCGYEGPEVTQPFPKVAQRDSGRD